PRGRALRPAHAGDFARRRRGPRVRPLDPRLPPARRPGVLPRAVHALWRARACRWLLAALAEGARAARASRRIRPPAPHPGRLRARARCGRRTRSLACVSGVVPGAGTTGALRPGESRAGVLRARGAAGGAAEGP